jgi:hypothetical protein
MITMVSAGIRRQASRVEKGEIVMGVVMDFFRRQVRIRCGLVYRCVARAGPKLREWGGLILELGGLRAH